MASNGQGPPADLFSPDEIKGQIQIAPQPAASTGQAGAGYQPPANLFSQQEMQPSAQPMAEMRAVQEPTTWIGKFGRWAENVSNDLKYGTDHTGIGTVLKRMGAHGVYAGEPEAVGDFMASLPLGLLKAAKGAAEASPQVMGGPKGQTLKGVEDILGGGLQAATMPAAFMAPEEAELGAKGAGAAGRAVGETAKSLTTGTRTVQEGLGNALRSTVSDVANKAGVEAPASKSMLGVIEETGNKIKGAAQSLYKQLDELSGGRWQRFDDRLAKIRERMAPLDPDLDNEQWENLEIQRRDTEVAQTNVIDELVKEGKITPDAGEKAKQTYQQSMALFDTKAGLKPAVSGANPDVVMSAKNPELANPEQFFKRVDKLHDSGRLQQALGEENADKLYRTANDAVIKARQVARTQKIAKYAGGTIAGAVGLGGVGKVIKAVSPGPSQ